MPDSIVEKIPPLASDQKSLTPAAQETSESLPKSVSLQLYKLMGEVVKKEINPQTVQAACACATEIHRMLKLNMEMKRLGQ